MANKTRFDGAYFKNAAGVYVQGEPVDPTLMAAATTGDVLTVKSDDTVHPRTITGAGGIAITVTADEIEVDGSGISGGAGSGSMVLLDTQTASNSASLNMVTGFSATYDEYELRFAIIPASDNQNLRLRMSSNGGSSWDSGASDYRYTFGRQRDGSASAFDIINRSAGQTYIELAANIGSDTGEGIQGTIRTASIRDTTLRKMIRWHTANMSDVGEVAWQDGAGARISASAFNGIQLFFGSGNVESGWARLYGIVK